MASALPVFRWLPHYRREWLRPDCIAGLTLAAYAVPVSLAYASLAGLPSQAGLYCYLIGGIVYALFGTSRQIAVGPTSAISILIGSAIGAMVLGGSEHEANLAMFTALLAGGIGIIAWILQLGSVVSFVSETILSGFKVGAGLVIASTQVPKLFGMSSGGNEFFESIVGLVGHLGDVNFPSLAVGIVSLALILLGERFLSGRPVALVVLVLSVVVMLLFPLADWGVKTVGSIPPGFPHLGMPSVTLADANGLLGLALACFLLSYVESISVARTFGIKNRYRIDPNQELLALGVANLAAGLASGYPLAGGMSQSAVNDKAGARTPLSLVFSSCAIALVLLFLTGFMANLPQPVLAAVVLVAIKDLMRLKELRHLKRVSKVEFYTAMAAVVGVLLFGILKGILLAALFSIILMIKQTAHPRITALGRFPDSNRFGETSRYPNVERIPGVLALRVEAAFLYFNVENIKDEILRLIKLQIPSARLVVIDLSTSPYVDLAGARMLSELHDQLAENGINLKLAEMHGGVRDLLRAEGLIQRLGGFERRMSISDLIDQSQKGLSTVDADSTTGGI
jgi:high affinity sulfate transporter 1